MFNAAIASGRAMIASMNKRLNRGEEEFGGKRKNSEGSDGTVGGSDGMGVKGDPGGNKEGVHPGLPPGVAGDLEDLTDKSDNMGFDI